MDLKEIKNRRMLANYLGIDYRMLTFILYAKKPESFYDVFKIPKRNGGVRTICAPSYPLKHVQRTISKKLMDIQQSYFLKTEKKTIRIVCGFTRKRGIIYNACRHRNRKYVLNVDLENFFDSFHFGRVKGFFQKNKYFMMQEDMAQCLANLVCFNGKLPQGAPSSPVITNLICSVLDNRIACIAKKYRMTYTRYADDLTFSTNNLCFFDNLNSFLCELNSTIEKSGFSVNTEKTRLQYCDSRQEVTGLVVNHKIGVKKEYYKYTRTMLHHLYCGRDVTYNGKKIDVKQLEGRLAFINQIDWYNNLHPLAGDKESKKKNIQNSRGFNARERQYQLFLFYKLFYCPDKPTIITEGKTDIVYIRAALQKLCSNYPDLIIQKDDGKYEYKVRFFNRVNRNKSGSDEKNRLNYFFNIKSNGADTMNNIYNLYTGTSNFPNYYEKLKHYGTTPTNPVILLFDNETKSSKPLKKFISTNKINGNIQEKYYLKIASNLYLATIPLVKGKEECEIEDLFNDDALCQKIGGKSFDPKGEDSQNHFGKKTLSEYIAKSKDNIDFDGFNRLLVTINEILIDFRKYLQNMK